MGKGADAICYKELLDGAGNLVFSSSKIMDRLPRSFMRSLKNVQTHVGTDLMDALKNSNKLFVGCRMQYF
jgi:hypothetical protein